MTASSTSPASSASSAPAPAGGSTAPATAPTRRVTDAPTRTFHWLFALCFTGAYLSAESEHWRLVHVTLGYTVAGLLVFRLLWGLAGPRQARLGPMLRKLAGLGPWLDGLRQGRPNWRQAQGLLMTAAVLLLLVSVVPLTLSGYATDADWGGEWLEEIHELAADAMLAMVLLHIALVAGLSLLRGSNQARPMLGGRIPGAGPDLARHNHGWMAVLLLTAVLAFWTLQWRDAPPDSLTAATWLDGGGRPGDRDDDED